MRDLNDMFPPSKQLTEQELQSKAQATLAAVDLDQNGYIDIEEFGVVRKCYFFDTIERVLYCECLMNKNSSNNRFWNKKSKMKVWIATIQTMMTSKKYCVFYMRPPADSTPSAAAITQTRALNTPKSSTNCTFLKSAKNMVVVTMVDATVAA